MKKVLTLIVMMTFAGAMNAQGLKGLLNKAKESVNKVTNNSGKTKPTTASTVSYTNQASTQLSNHQSESVSSDPMDLTPYIEKFATHKKTTNTKVITVDDLHGIQLAYSSENRVFAYVPSDGIFCFDEKGNIVKKWDKNESIDLHLLNFGRAVPMFNSGRIMADYKNGYNCDAVIYDKDIKEIKRFKNVERASQFVAGVACYTYSKLEGFGTKRYTVFVDINGNQILKNISDQWVKSNLYFDSRFLRPESEGLIAYCVPDASGKKILWGFRNAKGTIIIPAKYDMARDFSNGLAAVATGDMVSAKWGFIDKQGNLVIPQKFSNEPTSFDECGLAMVLDKDKKPTFIDKQGNIDPKRYERITPFNGGVALWQVSKHPNVVKLVDSKFNELKTLDSRLIRSIDTEDLYQDIYFCDYISFRMGKVRPFDNYFYFKFDGLKPAKYDGMTEADLGYGILDRNGNIVKAGVMGCFVDGIAPVFDDKTDEIGYVNMKGEWVIKFERSEF